MVELHYFGGLTYQELSETLKVSEATVDREIPVRAVRTRSEPLKDAVSRA